MFSLLKLLKLKQWQLQLNPAKATLLLLFHLLKMLSSKTTLL